MKTFQAFRPLLTIFAASALVGCHSKVEKIAVKTEPEPIVADTIKYDKVRKLSIEGDFDGDGRRDVLSEHFYSNVQKREIDKVADPFQMEWETVVKWFYDQDVVNYLALDDKAKTRLEFGTTHGLYCLLNIGDENGDGKDEVALVPDWLDDSRLNACRIYSLCDGKWRLLKKFDIYEGAFDFKAERPIFETIPEYLEKRNGRWVFHDETEEYENAEDVGKLLPLKLRKCN